MPIHFNVFPLMSTSVESSPSSAVTSTLSPVHSVFAVVVTSAVVVSHEPEPPQAVSEKTDTAARRPAAILLWFFKIQFLRFKFYFTEIKVVYVNDCTFADTIISLAFNCK